MRVGAWRLLVQTRHVERVHLAAHPAAVPSAAGSATPVVALGDDRVPVVFAGALLGETEVRVAADHKMLLLTDGRRRLLLWVDAVEDVVEQVPVSGRARPGEELVLGWSGGGRTLAVLDVERLLDLVVEASVQPAMGDCA